MRTHIMNYIRAGYPFLQIVTHEEARTTGLLKSICDELKRDLVTWSCRQGMVNLTTKKADGNIKQPTQMLEAMAKLSDSTVLIMRDLHMFLKNPPPPLVRSLREVLVTEKAKGKTLIIIGCEKVIPPEIEKEITMIEFDLPDRHALMEIACEVAECVPEEHAITMESAVTEELANAATGMTHAEAENAFSLSFVETGKWTPSVVYREKCQVVKRSNLLEVLQAVSTMDDVGGLDVAKDYIYTRQHAYSDEARAANLPMPKGLLLVGVPGGGKSLLARVVAHGLDIPLLRFDVGRVFGGIVGQSESNLRSVIKTAEAVAPCVLFIDELEKGFSGTASSGSTDGGTSSRVFGSFLTWMQDKTSPVYVVATANDVSALPPEFLRKGRFDEIFFVDLPTEAERREIWLIMYEKYNQIPSDFDTLDHIKDTDGFTGAEIEQVLVDAMWRAFAAGKKRAGTEEVTAAIAETLPLSRTMAEKIDAMRKWSIGRARPATSREEENEESHRVITV